MNDYRIYPLAGKRVWVAGHGGLVGSALVRRLASTNAEVLTADRKALDLRDQAAVHQWLHEYRPDAVFVAAATVGGIEANRTRPVEFLYNNLMIAANVIHGAAITGVHKLMFLGSSCFYPHNAEQPVSEATLLTGPLEPTNEWYAVAKIAGVKLCQAYRKQYDKDFIAVVPTNLYGPGDNFDLASSHVIPALIRKFHDAESNNAPYVELWGTGRALREYLHVDDAADGLVFLMEHYSDDKVINVAGGEEVSIASLAATIAEVVGYRGELRFDRSKPDGMARKILDGSKISAMGWKASTPLVEGLGRTYEWFKEAQQSIRL